MERHSQVTLTHTRELQNDTHGVQFITKHTLNQAHITIPTERLMKTSRKIHITQGTNYTCTHTHTHQESFINREGKRQGADRETIGYYFISKI